MGRCRWCSAACSARLADVHTDEEKEYIRTIKSIISDFIRDKKPENLAYYQRIYDWLDERHVPFSCGHENGKSTEWAELQSEFKNINEAFEDGKKEVIDHPDKYGLTKQPGVELEKEIIRYQREDMDRDTTVGDVARHFYGLCNHTLEEAARHVYKSWMGGTMDDVRRDMVELGKVLNAIKEEKK